MNIDELSEHLLRTWGTKTLNEFREAAECEKTGIQYESIRIPGGPRFALIVCVADIDQIARLERVFDFLDGGGAPLDWNTFTLGHILKRTGIGFSHESLHDEFGRRSAIVLCSTEPRSMQILTTAFDLKP